MNLKKIKSLDEIKKKIDYIFDLSRCFLDQKWQRDDFSLDFFSCCDFLVLGSVLSDGIDQIIVNEIIVKVFWKQFVVNELEIF